MVCDNYHTHKHADINAWLVKNPRVTLQFTDLRVVAEPGRGVLLDHHPPGDPPRFIQQRQRTVAAIGAFIDGWNQRSHPFVWTKTADEILPHP